MVGSPPMGMTGQRPLTEQRMKAVLGLMLSTHPTALRKPQILKAAGITNKCYPHTMQMLKDRGFIVAPPDNSRKWIGTREGYEWCIEAQGYPSIMESFPMPALDFQPPVGDFNKYDGDAMRHSRINTIPLGALDGNSTFTHAPAGSVSNGDVIRLNLTDIMQFIHAIIGDRSHGEISWVRDGKHFSVQVNDGVINLFLESN